MGSGFAFLLTDVGSSEPLAFPEAGLEPEGALELPEEENMLSNGLTKLASGPLSCWLRLTESGPDLNSEGLLLEVVLWDSFVLPAPATSRVAPELLL